MLRFRSVAAAVAALILSVAATVEAQTATDAQRTPVVQPQAPEVGQLAPDFTIPWADSAGVRSAPVKLSDLRGKVVVIAFYPADRTRGCTAEMTKFRDEYKTLFGENVVVLPISKDSLGSHASWAKEMKLPFALGSDEDLKVAELYGSRRPGAAVATRNTFVVGKDGRISWRALNFNALTEASYDEMAAEIAKARQ